MLSHLHIPELYYLLFGLTLGQPVRNIGSDKTVSVEGVWAAAWGAAAPSRQSSAAVAARITLCPEAVVILLGAVRSLIHTDPSNLPDWLRDHPVAIIQVSGRIFIKNVMTSFCDLAVALIPILLTFKSRCNRIVARVNITLFHFFWAIITKKLQI